MQTWVIASERNAKKSSLYRYARRRDCRDRDSVWQHLYCTMFSGDGEILITQQCVHLEYCYYYCFNIHGIFYCFNTRNFFLLFHLSTFGSWWQWRIVLCAYIYNMYCTGVWNNWVKALELHMYIRPTFTMSKNGFTDEIGAY